MKTENTLKAMRMDKTNTQQEIAELLGCSRISYISYENGSRSIPLKGLVILTAYYNVSADFLLGRTPYKLPYPACSEAAPETAPAAAMSAETMSAEASPAKAMSVKTTARIIKSLRKSSRATQKQVADFLGCTQSGYCCYESGKREISAETAVKLSVYYNVSVDYILGLTRSTEKRKI
ncbi:MAG: helix-turn-helix domain-containing protein [Oscillospiraceae bacterium]|nr:helix-turn-helix domain-containing protein [Oscillospiraceae bacterium]